MVATRSSKPDSVKAEIERKSAEREENAMFIPGAATVSGCCIIDQDGERLLDVTAGGFTAGAVGSVAASAMQVIASVLEDSDECRCYSDVGAVIYGLRIRERIRLLALDALAFSATSDVKIRVPVGAWFSPHFEASLLCDPYETAVASTFRNDIGYTGLCSLLGVPLPPEDLDASPSDQAAVALSLSKALQLFGS